MKISPSMLACDFSQSGKEIQKLEKAGADMVHMDIMDGCFVPNISFGAGIVKALRAHCHLPFDVHLMLRHPFDYIDDFAKAGADIITFHVEADCDIEKTIEKIKSHKIKAGLSLKPKTDTNSLIPYLKYIDMVLIMTVEPGFGGQKLMEEQLFKADEIKKEILKRNFNVMIEADGGINLETIVKVKQHPIDICVSGTCVFNSDDMQQTINILKS